MYFFVLQLKARLQNPFCSQVAALQSQISQEDFELEMNFIKANIAAIESIGITNLNSDVLTVT